MATKEEESGFFSGIWHLVHYPCARGWSYTHVHTRSTDWKQWVTKWVHEVEMEKWWVLMVGVWGFSYEADLIKILLRLPFPSPLVFLWLFTNSNSFKNQNHHMCVQTVLSKFRLSLLCHLPPLLLTHYLYQVLLFHTALKNSLFLHLPL